MLAATLNTSKVLNSTYFWPSLKDPLDGSLSYDNERTDQITKTNYRSYLVILKQNIQALIDTENDTARKVSLEKPLKFIAKGEYARRVLFKPGSLKDFRVQARSAAA